MKIFNCIFIRILSIYSIFIFAATNTYGAGVFDAVNPILLSKTNSANKYYSKIAGDSFDSSVCKPFPSKIILNYIGVGRELAAKKATIFVVPIGAELTEIRANKKGELTYPYRAFINLKSRSTWVVCPTEYTLSLSESELHNESIENDKKIVEEQLAKKAEYLKKNEERFKKCPFCKFSQSYEMEHPYNDGYKYGGEYLDAIFRGDYDTQNYISWGLLTEFRDNRKSNSGMNLILTGLSGGNELTVLEETLGYYMARYAQSSNSCIDGNSFSVAFSHTIPGVIYYDQYGAEDFRIEPITTNDIYRVNNEFTLACNELCNKQGVLVMQAMGINSNFKEYRVMSVFRAIDELNKTYGCRSNERKQFEQNMLKMWLEERKLALNLKNTLQRVLQQ